MALDALDEALLSCLEESGVSPGDELIPLVKEIGRADEGGVSAKGDLIKNPKGPDTGVGRVLRGGSWFGYGRDCRCAYRFDWTPVVRLGIAGFRLARS